MGMPVIPRLPAVTAILMPGFTLPESLAMRLAISKGTSSILGLARRCLTLLILSLSTVGPLSLE
jgi:hypothetical protein